MFLSRDKPHQPNQSKPHWFGLDDFLKINRTKPHHMHFYFAVWMTFMLKTEPNRTANTPIIDHMKILVLEDILQHV